MTEDLLAKAKETQSPEELLALLQENGMEDFTKEEAESLYAQLHMTGEVTDEELENVTGGKVSVGGQKYKVVASGTRCFTGKWEYGFDDVTQQVSYGDEKYLFFSKRTDHQGLRTTWLTFSSGKNCGSCIHLGFTKALTGYCEVEHDS